MLTVAETPLLALLLVHAFPAKELPRKASGADDEGLHDEGSGLLGRDLCV